MANGQPDTTGEAVEVTLFVPCYNEERNVAGAVDKIVKMAQGLKLSYEILVFDDASKDRTSEVVRQYQADHREVPLRLFRNAENRGVAWNFVEGAFRGRGKYYRLVCGDDIEPLETHIEIVSHRGEADIIVPYFTRIEGRPLLRHLLSRSYTRLVNTASGTPLRYYNGCPLYRREDVLRYHIEATGLGYQAEFLTRLLAEGRSYIEVALVAQDREGSGSLTLRNVLSVGHSLLNMALRRLRVALLK